jgi:response regulator RpfG family c-di-GMP phosphodiesterase
MSGHGSEQRARILVVDDEEAIREVLSDFLSMEGFEVNTASDGEKALAELSRAQYDLVLSDLKMPTMGGLELLQAIQRNMPSVVTVIMTGFGTVETAIGALKEGAYDYILKPFKVEEVVLTIRRGLEKHRLEAENIRLKEALSLYKVSEAIASSLSLDAVLRTVTDAAISEVGADFVTVLLDDGAGSLFVRDAAARRDLPASSTMADLNGKAIREWFKDQRILRISGENTQRFFEPTEGKKPVALVVSPLKMQARTLGYLCAVSYAENKTFSEGQRKMLAIVGDRAAAAIENARLYEDLKATFHQTIQGLANAIDKMDRYTSGHSERVAAYAQILAIKLGLPPEMIEIVRQSALMHDVGKIGCVMNLNKPGKLSLEEYEVFKQHPGFGKDILNPITFLHPLIPGVYSHHERWDGAGYPNGLKGQEIPLIARIVSVADTYDAMTSDRAYRKALPHTVSTSEIKRCSGAQFDPDVAAEFCEAIEEHRKEGGRTAGERRESETG